jgi:hypothetical protein
MNNKTYMNISSRSQPWSIFTNIQTIEVERGVDGERCDGWRARPWAVVVMVALPLSSSSSDVLMVVVLMNYGWRWHDGRAPSYEDVMELVMVARVSLLLI